MATAEDLDALLSPNDNTDPACFLPEGSESLYQYIREDLKNDANSELEELVVGENYTVTVDMFLKAAEKGKTDFVLKILEKDAGLINCKDCDGYSALHRAAYNGHVEVVKVLLKNGADICSLTEDKWQPLHCACRWGKRILQAAVQVARGNFVLAQLEHLCTFAQSQSEWLCKLKALVFTYSDWLRGEM